MALDLGELYAKVVLDDSDYNQRMNALPQTAEQKFSDIAKLAAGYLSAKTMSNFAAECVKSFSDMQEASNRFNAVFGSIRHTATSVSEKLQEEFRLSKMSAESMLASSGDILTGFGFSPKDALELSERAARLGADLYSFTNYAGGAKGATEALTAAMLGETEKAKALGVVIRQDSEEYMALVNQYQKTEGKTLQQAKAMAALELATQQSKNAIGDWNRPGETYAQTQQTAIETTRKLTAAIGEQLVKGVQPVMKGYNSLSDSFLKLSKDEQAFIVNTGIISSTLLTAKIAMSLMGVAQTTVNRLSEAHTALAAREAAAVTASANSQVTANASIGSSNAARYNVSEVLSRRKMLLDAQEAAGMESKALRAAKANLAIQQSNEAQRYQSFLMGGTGTFTPSSTVLVAKAQVDELTKSYQKAQDAAKKAGIAYQGVRNEAIASGAAYKKTQAAFLTSQALARNAALQMYAAATATRMENHLLNRSFDSVKAGALSALNGIRSGAVAAANGVKILTASAVGLGKAFLPVMILSAAISGTMYLLNRAKNAAQDRIDLAGKSADAAREEKRAGEELRAGDQKDFERLKTLASYTNLSNSEQNEAIKIIQKLKDRYKSLGTELEFVNGKLKIGADAQKRMNEEQWKAALLEARKVTDEAKKDVGASVEGLKSTLPGGRFMYMDEWEWLRNLTGGVSERQEVVGLTQAQATAEAQLIILQRKRREYDAAGKKAEVENLDSTIDKLKKYIAASKEEEALKKEFKQSSSPVPGIMSEPSKEERRLLDDIGDLEFAKKFDPAPLTEKLNLLQKKREEIFAKQKEFASVEALLSADNSRLGLNELAVKKDILAVEKEIAEVQKERARLLLQISQMQWNAAYNFSDNYEKSDMLEKRRKELEKKNSESFASRGFKDTGNVADYTAEELERYREILSIQQRIDELKKSAGDRSEQMNQRDADYERQKEIRLARRALDWKIDDLKDQGKTAEAKAVLDAELAKAREAAAAAKATYEDLKRNTEGKVLDDFGARMLEKSRAAFEEADRYQEEMEGKVRAEEKDSEKGVKGAKETAISFSAATLAQMVGGATIQEKQLKEQQNIVKKVDDVNTTVKDKKFEIRCIA